MLTEILSRLAAIFSHGVRVANFSLGQVQLKKKIYIYMCVCVCVCVCIYIRTHLRTHCYSLGTERGGFVSMLESLEIIAIESA